MAGFVFYDTETTGTNRDFDQILQFAAIRTDENLNELERFDIRCQCLPWVVPAPMALKVTGIHPKRLCDPALPTFYDMMSEVRRKLDAWSPATFLGYNTLKFDEPLLQRAFWQCLHPPYATVTNGNARMDLYPLAQAASHLVPNALTYPVNEKGRKVFKLDQLAPRNGFPHERAHDALGDVEATIFLARCLAERAPQLWQIAVAAAPKSAVSEILALGEPALVVEYFAYGPSVWWGQRIDGQGSKASTASVARLDRDWASLRLQADAVLTETLQSSPKPLRQIALNKSPIVFSESQARIHWGFELEEEARRQSAFLKSNPGYCSQLLETQGHGQDEWEQAEHLEQMIFEGFPSRRDQSLMDTFHAADWRERAGLVRQFEDTRFRQLAQRLVYLAAPELLAEEDVGRLRTAIATRLHAPSGSSTAWRTLSDAAKENETLRQDAGSSVLAADIDAWLASLAELYPVTAER